MRTIIAGSRTISDYLQVEKAIAHSGFSISTVICGCARGVDRLGERWAKEHCIPVEYYPANWDEFGKRAGYLRNTEMAKVADALIAVTSGSPGTRHMIQIATKAKLRVFVLEVNAMHLL